MLFFDLPWWLLCPVGSCASRKAGSQHSSLQVDYLLWNQPLLNQLLFNSFMYAWKRSVIANAFFMWGTPGKEREKMPKLRRSWARSSLVFWRVRCCQQNGNAWKWTTVLFCREKVIRCLEFDIRPWKSLLSMLDHFCWDMVCLSGGFWLRSTTGWNMSEIWFGGLY